MDFCRCTQFVRCKVGAHLTLFSSVLIYSDVPSLFGVIYNDTVGRDICCSLKVNKLDGSITDVFIILPADGPGARH